MNHIIRLTRNVKHFLHYNYIILQHVMNYAEGLKSKRVKE